MNSESSILPYTSSALPQGPWLVFAPHPDDETFGMGGSLARAAREGIRTAAVVLTDGRLGGDPGIRKDEARQAARVLGLSELIFWDLPDRSLHHAPIPLADLRRVLDSLQPQTVFLPGLQELHPDHRAATSRLLPLLSDCGFDQGLWLYEISRQLEINALIDISRVIGLKEEALACYRSQLEQQSYRAAVLGINQARAYTLGRQVSHAEGFWVCRDRSVSGVQAELHNAVASSLGDAAPGEALVSVIVRTKDRPQLLEQALQSVAAQSHPRVEAVVVNDYGCPVDQVIAGLRPELPFLQHIEHETAKGRAEAANTGVRNAQGEWLCFLDDDDLLEPKAIERLLQAARLHKVKVAYGQVALEHYTTDGEKDETRNDLVYRREFDPQLLLLQNYIPWNALLIHKDVFQECGCLDTGLILNEDWEFLLRASSTYHFIYTDALVARYRCFGQATAFGGRFSQTDIRESESRVRRRYWHRVEPEALATLQEYLRRLIAEEMGLDFQGLERSLQAVRESEEGTRLELARVQQRVQRLEAEKLSWQRHAQALTETLSWRVTAPLRAVRRVQGWAARRKKKFRNGRTGSDRISILTPVCDPREDDLRRMLDSVLGQTYPHWELCIADDASRNGRIAEILREYASRDARIKLRFRDRRGHIARASNTALEMAVGEYVALVDHDDCLEPDALEQVAACFHARSHIDMLYTDEDILLADGSRGPVHRKPAWSPDLFLSNMYTCHLGVYRRSLVKAVGGFRVGFEGSQDYDLVLRLTEKSEAIYHLPRVLYHWRCSPTSTAMNEANKEYAFASGKKALEEALSRRAETGRVTMAPNRPGHYRVHLTSPPARCSVFLTAEPGPRAESWLRTWSGLVADVWSPGPGCSGLPPAEATERAQGEVLLFWNPALRPLGQDWLPEVLARACRERTGAVSGHWIDDQGLIVHAGILFGLKGAWDYSHKSVPADADGYFGRLLDCANSMAVGQEFFAVGREKLKLVGGMDEQAPRDVRGIDACIKLHCAGYDNVVLPWVRLLWEGSRAEEHRTGYGQPYLRSKWGWLVDEDPFYSPGLSREQPFSEAPGQDGRQGRCRAARS